MGQRVEDNAFHQKIAPWVMEHTANGQHAEFFVVLADQADLSPAANLTTKTEKGRFVYQTLLDKAQTTQGPILQLLQDRNIEQDLDACLQAGASAEGALFATLDKYVGAFQRVSTPFFQERVYDIKDVFHRLLWQLRAQFSCVREIRRSVALTW